MNKSIYATELSANDSSAKDEVGALRVVDSKVYRYVRVEDSALAVGDVVEYSDTSGYEVTKDRAGGSSLGRIVAGVAIGTITDAYYGWIQVSGLNAYVKTDGGVAAGDPLTPHATADGQADTAVSSSTAVNTEAQVFGYALSTDTATTTPNSIAVLRCL